MRFFLEQSSSPLFAAAVALLLILPVFLVATPARASSPSAPAQATAPASPSPSQNPLSTYRSAGSANPDLSVLVSVDIPLRNLPLLSSYVQESSDPSSAGFRHFLNYSQVSQLFLPTQSQYDSVLGYLTSKGFSVVSSSLNSMIVVRGTVAQVSEYLGQGVQLFTNGTYAYYQTTGPSTLAGAYSFASNSTGLLMRPDISKVGAPGSGAIPAQNVTFAEGSQATKLLQTVYNSTGLLSKGVDGKGYTIGILDFYGYSLVTQDMAGFDSTFGYPAPPSFTISPIGPYNPNLGTALGWDAEIDLDTQASHAMAPGANIVLYPANGELPLSSAVAAIVQAGKADVVTQSFGLPEWEYYEAGSLAYLFNSVFSDDYYMLGSAMGMTFVASAGDGGGSGFSVGPLGAVEYPSSSPYVTGLGGTSTYISTAADGSLIFNQTAWSSIGFVPNFVNEGGSSGGVSALEPAPWYQAGLNVPSSFPDGRMVPDVSLDASGAPATYIEYDGAPEPIAGTSEASPLFAGLLAVLMDAVKGPLGLFNPALYQMAGNSKTYQSAFTPITFGYTIPWVSKSGYNLATGWGAPNIGEMARIYPSLASSSALDVGVEIVASGKQNFTDYTPGDKIGVVAVVTSPSGAAVTSGTFTAALQTLGGTSAAVSLTYASAQHGWTGTITVGNESGMAYVDVSGSASGGATGNGFATTFVGYLADFVQPLSPYPWTFLPGLQTAISITDLFGNNAPFAKESVAFENYSIISNTYSKVGSGSLNFSSADDYYQGVLKLNIPGGPTDLVTEGSVIGYLPFFSGISLAGTSIYPEVVTDPGTVAPGQSLTIVASVTAPENIALTESLATGTDLATTIAEGSNVTATLVSPTGQAVESITLPERACAQALRVCGAALTNINGYMTIPAKASPGLYTVLLSAVYDDETTGFNYTGSYFGQVYVAPGMSTPTISISPSVLFEGENATINANITLPSGKEATTGFYDATVYPDSVAPEYSTIMHAVYEAFGMVPLAYDAKTSLWTANVTLPSPDNSALVATINPEMDYYGGPYDVYVSGISSGAVPTSSVLSAEQGFNIQPYVYTADASMSVPPQTTRLAFSNVTIAAGSSPLVLSNDYFVGNNTVSGEDVTVDSSFVNGTLNIDGGQVTLSGVTGGTIVAKNALVVLQHSSVTALDLGSLATVSVDPASTYAKVTPSLPVVSISSPLSNTTYTGSVNATVSVQGSGVSLITFFLDGKRLPSLSASGSEYSYQINTTSLPDGRHTFTAVATQSDLMSSSASVTFVTDNQLAAVTTSLVNANKTIASLNGTLATANGNIASLKATVKTLTDYLYGAAAVAVVALIVGLAVAASSLRKGAPWKY